MIRQATLADVPGIVALAERFIAETGYHAHIRANPSLLGDLATAILATPDRAVVFLDDRDGDLVGMLAMHLISHPLSGERVASEIVWWVNPECRGSGVRLLRASEQWAREQRADIVQMVAPTAHVEAFYAAVGYAPVERLYQRRLTQ